jgi:hypothetical protein
MKAPSRTGKFGGKTPGQYYGVAVVVILLSTLWGWF